MKVLLIEDNKDIIRGLFYSFMKEGIDLVSKEDVKSAREYLEKEKCDIIILDLSLPDGFGLDLFKETIVGKGIPTIILTAVDEEDEIVRALELGCEDYMTKPFSTKELFARINKILSRKEKREIVRSQDIEYDMNKMNIKKSGKDIEVSSLELKIVNLLFTNVNRVVKRETILDKIWEWTGNDVDDHTVTVYLNRIRNKLGNDIIKTIKGVGYRIDGE